MTDSEIDDLIDLILDDRFHGTEMFEERMRGAGKYLAEQFAHGVGVSGKSIAIVTSAQDREFVTEGFVKSLKHLNARTTVSTLWNKYNPPVRFLPSMSVLVAQHHEDHPAHVDCLAYVCSSLAEDATVADGLSRMSVAIDATNLCVFSLTGSSGEFKSLDKQLEYRGCPKPRVQLLEGDRSISLASRGMSLRKALRDHLMKAYGWKGLAYIPQALGGPKPVYVA